MSRDKKMPTQVTCQNDTNKVIESTKTENIVNTENKITTVIVHENPIIIQHLCGSTGDKTSHLQPYEYIIEQMTENQLSYTLPEVPKNDIVLATMNGINVNYALDGVNFTITNYPAGDISTTDSLKIIYFK